MLEASRVAVNGVDESELKFSGKYAVFVLGPSAAGKTYMTKHTLLPRILKGKCDNGGWTPQLGFTSIDGGTIRDVSICWQEMKDYPHRIECVKGFSDLFSKYFQPRISKLKKRLFVEYRNRGLNIIVPDTATGLRNSVVDRIQAAYNDGYKIVMSAVFCSKAVCCEQGHSREIREGKKYSSASWPIAMHRIMSVFNSVREIGCVNSPFFIIDNSDRSNAIVYEIPPHHYVHIDWHFGGALPVHATFEAYLMESENIDFLKMKLVHSGWVRKQASKHDWLFGRLLFSKRFLEVRVQDGLVWILWYDKKGARVPKKYFPVMPGYIARAAEDDGCFTGRRTKNIFTVRQSLSQNNSLHKRKNHSHVSERTFVFEVADENQRRVWINKFNSVLIRARRHSKKNQDIAKKFTLSDVDARNAASTSKSSKAASCESKEHAGPPSPKVDFPTPCRIAHTTSAPADLSSPLQEAPMPPSLKECKSSSGRIRRRRTGHVIHRGSQAETIFRKHLAEDLRGEMLELSKEFDSDNASDAQSDAEDDEGLMTLLGRAGAIVAELEVDADSGSFDFLAIKKILVSEFGEDEVLRCESELRGMLDQPLKQYSHRTRRKSARVGTSLFQRAVGVTKK
jgi:hypothetical protein